MRTFNIHEAKTQLSRLVDQAARGESFIIAKAGRPLVKVTPLEAPTGAGVARVWFHERPNFGSRRLRPPGSRRNRAPVRRRRVKLLLDTHVLLWAAGTPERLASDVRALLNDPDNQPIFSAASFCWEIAIKRTLGQGRLRRRRPRPAPRPARQRLF